MHQALNEKEVQRLRQLPAISRAREHRLYALDGSRWVDCWADGGRALLGHRPGGLGRRIKNEIDRGLYAPYPSRWDGRLEKALLEAFPGYDSVRIFRNAESAKEVLGLSDWPADPLDLLPSSISEGTDADDAPEVLPALWGRPLLPGHPMAQTLWPIMPLSGLGEVQPVLFAAGINPESAGEPISPVLAAALGRAALITRSHSHRDSAGLDAPAEAQDEGILGIIHSSADIWERRGPYLTYKGSESTYDELFERLFARRVLIAPSAARPSVFPADPSVKEARLILNGGLD